MRLGEAEEQPVVDDDAVFVQHQAVAAPARLQRLGVVEIDPIQKFGGVRPPHFQLAQGRVVEQAQAFPHHACLPADRLKFAFARPGIAGRALPSAVMLEAGAQTRLGGMQGRFPNRLVEPPLAAAGDDAQGDRRKGRAVGGDAHFGHGAARGFRQPRNGVQVGGLALIQGHADRGVAFQMLHGAEVLRHGQIQIRQGDIVQQIDPLPLGCAARRPAWAAEAAASRIGGAACRAIAGTLRRRAPRSPRLAIGRFRPGDARQSVLQVQVAGRSAQGGKAGGQFTGRESRQPLVVAQLGLGMAQQMHRWRRPAGHPQRIAGDGEGFALEAALVQAIDPHPPQRLAAAGVEDHGIRMHRRAQRPHLFRQISVRRGSGIDQGGHRNAQLGEIQGGPVQAIVVAGQRDAFPGLDAEAPQIGLHGPQQHDAGTVVVLEHQGLLDGAGGDDDALGPHPQPALPQGGCRMPLHQARAVVVVQPRDLGGGAGFDARMTLHRLQLLGKPGVRRLAGDQGRFPQQAAAEARILFRDQHRSPGLGFLQGRGQPDRAAAADQDIDAQMAMGVLIRVRPRRRLAKSGQPANQGFIEAPGRPDEGLVVEAGGKQVGAQVQRPQQVPVQARPVVQGSRLQPFADGRQAGPGDGFGADALP